MAQAQQARKKRATAKQFLNRQTPAVKEQLETLLDGYAVKVAPALTYVRILTQDGTITLAYAIPARNTVRLDIPALIDDAPAKLRRRVERGGHNRRKFDIRELTDVEAARAILKWIADHQLTAAT